MVFWVDASDEEQKRDHRDHSPDGCKTAETEHLGMLLIWIYMVMEMYFHHIYKFAVHFSLARVNITDTRTTDNKTSWVVRHKLVHTSASKIRHQLVVSELTEQIYR